MEIILRTKDVDEHYQLAIKRQEGLIEFVVLNESHSFILDFHTDLDGWSKLKTFVDDGIWEYEKSLKEKS